MLAVVSSVVRAHVPTALLVSLWRPEGKAADSSAILTSAHAIPQAAEPAQRRAWQQGEGGAEVATATIRHLRMLACNRISHTVLGGSFLRFHTLTLHFLLLALCVALKNL